MDSFQSMCMFVEKIYDTYYVVGGDMNLFLLCYFIYEYFYGKSKYITLNQFCKIAKYKHQNNIT